MASHARGLTLSELNSSTLWCPSTAPSSDEPYAVTAANLTCIVGGILVFGDALAAGILLAVQIVAFGLVAVAALVTPGRQTATT